MSNFFALCLVLGLIKATKCDLSLQIIKNTEDTFTPVSSVVEEKLGANFSLLCELVSSINDNINTYFDDQISWGRETVEFKFSNETDLKNQADKKSKELYDFLSRSEVNKAVKKFDPLRSDDKGLYFCMSLKYMLFKIVRLIVRNNIKTLDNSIISKAIVLHFEGRPYREYLFCNEDMFKCMSNGACINQHYVCDGKRDCKDGSDESPEKCNGDPCKDKLQCDDGRCIPTAWCCDRHHDPNCTVRNRPTCCQLLSEPYEELEYGSYVPYNIKHVKSNGARYLFISVCILSTFFSVVLLLLILSKVVIFAKKSNYVQARNNHFSLEGISLHHRSMLSRNDQSNYRRNYPCDIHAYRNNIRMPRHNRNNVILDNGGDISDPLLVPFRSNGSISRSILDQPPAYSDVISNNSTINNHASVLNGSEPPPPYTSREVLNDDRSDCNNC